jgi:predicted ATPase
LVSQLGIERALASFRDCWASSAHAQDTLLGVMLIKNFRIVNFRVFADTLAIPCERVNVFLGPNNAGKSSILCALYAAQTGSAAGVEDFRMGPKNLAFETHLAVENSQLFGTNTVAFSFNSDANAITANAGIGNPILGTRGQAVFFPLFSGRRSSYVNTIDEQAAQQVHPDQYNMPAVLDSATSRGNANANELLSALRKVIGEEVVSVPSFGGKTVGIYVNNKVIKIDRLGSGVDRAVRMLVDMIGYQGRIFLLEEPENDLHPTALKNFLEVIDQCLGHNQLFVTTHSPVVLKYLAARADSAIFEVEKVEGAELPTSTISRVDDNPSARRHVLNKIGHELSDFDLYDAWLILEESTMERLIRDVLIPRAVPELLGRLGTVASDGASDVEARVGALLKMFLYSRQEAIYRDKTWVCVDGDDAGKKALDDIRQKHPSVATARLYNAQRLNLEQYYPNEFRTEVDAALQLPDKRQRREQKRLLFQKVFAAMTEDDALKQEFIENAKDIVGFLKSIAATLKRT